MTWLRLFPLTCLGAALMAAACGGTANAPAGSASGGGPTSAAAASAPTTGSLPASGFNSELVKSLVAKANQEGSVSIETVDSVLPASDNVKKAFLQYFQPLGLKVDVQFGGGPQPAAWTNTQTAIETGAAPQFDLLLGNGTPQVFPYLKVTAPIENWQELVKAVNPNASSGKSKIEDFSPAPFTGRALLFVDYYSILAYNTKVAKDSLPSKQADLADPKYKGRFVVSPFSTDSLLKLTVAYGKDKALELVKGIGANAAGVKANAAGIQDILAGTIDFQGDQVENVLTQKALNPNVPLDYKWFTDATPFDQQFYAVPLKAKHPAAATLFALWSTTDDARASYLPTRIWLNLTTGHNPADDAARKTLDEVKPKVVNMTSAEGLPILQWLQDTPEGKAYADEFTKALTKRN